jgi:diphosphomevalonate decarboxylase
MAKDTAVACAIQGLIKYHGLTNKRLRIPFHDSISVCVENLTTTSTIQFDQEREHNEIIINGANPTNNEASRILAVVNPLRKLGKSSMYFRLESKNSLTEGKGLGFSAAAFASIALASATALELDLNHERLSEFARLGAGSASRSVVGGFSIWYAQRNDRSFARQLASADRLPLAIGIVPIPSTIKTEFAHEESVQSPFFRERVRVAKKIIPRMMRAIRIGDLDEVCKLAEHDSLSLHAVTMTGKSGLLLMAPETVEIIRRILSLRERKLLVWYSLDTGPSVYVNTHQDCIDEVCKDLETSTGLKVLKSGVGGPARLVNNHLF